MLIYPARFPLESRDKVEARKVREGFRFNRDKESACWNSEMGALRIRYVLRIWRVFVAEAARLHLWHLAEMDFHCREFLRLLTIDVGDHGLGSMVNHVSGGILPEVQRQFERSAEWRSFQAALLRMAKHFERQPREETKPGASVSQPQAVFTHTPDYATIRFHGKAYTLTANQAKIVRVLHEAWERRLSAVSAAELLAAVESETSEVRSFFRGSPLWKTLVIQGPRRGTYRLNLPAPKRNSSQ